MKHIAIVALMLNLGVAGVYAQQRPVKMTFSGTLGPSTLSLQPNTNTDEQNLAGNGTLGPFTFRESGEREGAFDTDPFPPTLQPIIPLEAGHLGNDLIISERH